ncbi:MAG: Holliday junction branch migration protein RuvA [Oscillospiraceae bacterium]|nr:Holliday junction branch migration protein RuvA [Oscillospiraceae bacterium]
MIHSLTGKVIEKSLDEVVISCGGVGFLVSVPQTAQGAIAPIGEETTLYTYLNVKEDALDLYGFATKEEQRAFKILTTVSGVGPKAGLAILSALTPDRVALAVSSGDYKAFTAAQGVGPKLAQRIVLELKGKFTDTTLSGVTIEDISAAATATGNVSQAISALVALGYTQSQAATAVAKLDTNADVQTLIKQALRLIAGGKI